MKTSKLLVAGIVILLSGIIIWYVGFSGKVTDFAGAFVKAESVPSQVKTEVNAPGQGDPNQTPAPEPTASEPNAPPKAVVEAGQDPNGKPETASDPNAKPEEANQPGGSNGQEGPRARRGPNARQAPDAAEEPNEPMEALNLKDVEMKDIVKKITDWTGQTVIPTSDAMKQKITIFAPKKLTRDKALFLIYAALRTQGYMAEQDGDVIYLKPLKDAKLGKVPVIGPDEPLALYENKEQIVQKFFKLKNYNPDEMAKVIQPFISDYGMVTSDPTTGTVAAIETITNLMRIGTVIEQFDVPEAEQTVSELIPIHNGDPVDVVQLLRIVLDSSETNSNNRRYSSYNRYSPRDTSVSTTVAGQGKMPIILIPQSKNKVIIVRASAQDMKTVKDWIEKLDLSDPVQSEYETVALSYANAREVSRGIEEALQSMPGSELRPSVLVRPLEQSRQLMIFGREDLRKAVKELIKEIDLPSGVFETKNFDLEYADPEQIQANIESLYETEAQDSGNYYSYMRRMQSNVNPTDVVKVIPLMALQRLTVIASPENMVKIEKQIKEWDKPLDVDQVKPRIIALRNSDPVQMAQLLSKLFSEEDDSSTQFIRMILMGDSQTKKKIIGPLYGQLTFEAVPGSKKIIVISKVPEAYEVIDNLIKELDGQEMAEVPEVIQLNYADPEILAERLNALFNESGTNANIRFSDRSLNDSPAPTTQGNNNNNNANRPQGGNNQADVYSPWWNQQRQATNEEPISNVIGKVRFIPDTHSKSLLVLSAPEFMESIRDMVTKLDIPGKQVLIKAIVVEVDHSSMTSLGMQLSTNASSFGSIGENSVQALSELTRLTTHGSSTTVSSSLDVYGLIDFLSKTVKAKILNQQALWTKDNEAASFFKGDLVPFKASSSVGISDRETTSVTFDKVGMTLEIRPSITPEDKVDMLISVELSQLSDNIVNSQPVRGSMTTETKMIVENGQTLMLAGILFQKDSLVQRKVPLLGDIPLLGALFRHKVKNLTNNELIVFIIPEVVDDGATMSSTAEALMKEPLKKLNDVRGAIKDSFKKENIDFQDSDPNAR
ncbi:MAG: hypothetical protein K9N55_19250 [Phycisphaerae bacterium]|nr:hypothetical protein [Phycisphaerae bacterium]